MEEKVNLLTPLLEQFSSTEVILILGGSAFLIGFGLSLLFKKSNKKEIEQPSTSENKETITVAKTGSPYKDYGKMDTTRAKEEFDMEEDEIADFMQDLKSQIEEELTYIKKFIDSQDFNNLKNSIHKIKGSAVNLGEGGIATLLYDFNHYLSEGKKDLKDITEMYEDILYYKEQM